MSDFDDARVRRAVGFKDSGEREVRCPHGYFVINAKSLCLQCHPEPVSLPLPLAQRILAALEHGWMREQDPHDLARELRAVIGK